MFSVILMLLFLLVLRLGCWNLIIGSLLHLVADKLLSRFLIILDLYRLRILINFVRRGLITGWSLIASSVQVLLLDVELSYGSELIFNLLLIRLVIFDFLLIGASNKTRCLINHWGKLREILYRSLVLIKILTIVLTFNFILIPCLLYCWEPVWLVLGLHLYSLGHSVNGLLKESQCLTVLGYFFLKYTWDSTHHPNQVVEAITYNAQNFIVIALSLDPFIF